MRRCLRAIFCVVCMNALFAGKLSAGAEEGLFQAAKIIYSSAQEQPDELRVKSYRNIRSLLDTIVSEFPGTDLAVRILLQDKIEGVDVAQLDAFLKERGTVSVVVEPDPQREIATELGFASIPEAPDETVSTAIAQIDETNINQSGSAALPPRTQYAESDAQTENALGLSKNDIRDLQARLLVIGQDPNGVDGAIGKGTRAAIIAWQSSIGAVETGYMSADLLAELKAGSETNLNIWLEDAENARTYAPPLIALTPGNMSGSWRYVTNCGTKSKFRKRLRITGTLSMSHTGGGNYSGTLVNSQGLRGRVSATLRGRSVSSVTNFGLLIGKVSLKARVDETQLVLRGRDSNGCSFYASK